MTYKARLLSIKKKINKKTVNLLKVATIFFNYYINMPSKWIVCFQNSSDILFHSSSVGYEWVLFNGISTFVGHLMPRKVRLVLSSMRVLGHGFFNFFIVFDSIWPDIGEKDLVRFQWKSEVFWKTQNVLKFSLVDFMGGKKQKTTDHTMPNFVYTHQT